ncbi:Phage infection protein [Actinoplanes sp. SE50]|uniref:YhgE/Pip family protein n=1 Tax=unclassified Actinoplanes TaxID=2626549 RepID=UPI00023ECDD3|nr:MULTISPECIES: YhgE/Pip family protein [unclassified Actinoplanes]AEV81566.1 Phage infection protein [Actinoplanes sp. SE50/110]ATO79968.1 Phage infection protein [Actinoplanes sp. SE50]SLL97370.1 phage infection protein [Actinoplanes sp. SE50/110]
MRTLPRWAAALLVPVLATTALLAAFQDPAGHLETVTAAVVNGDEPVTVNGRTVPLGRELAARLVAHTGDNYTWVLTGADDAAAGLNSGRYRVAVTIPANFSRAATSVGNADPATAERARVSVSSSRTAAGIDPVVSRTLTGAAVATLNQTVVETYLDNVYLGFNRMHRQLGDAADGAGKVSDGATRVADGNRQLVVGLRQLAAGSDALADGTDRLSTGASTLADGTGELRDGANRLATGTGQLATGAGRLASGAGQVAAGTGKLADGLGTLRDSTKNLPTQTRKLADGAEQVAEGNRKLAGTVVPIADQIVNGIDRLPDLDKLADRCETPADVCAQLRRAADALAAAGNPVADLRNQVVTFRDGISALADGSQRVADGADQLADRTPALTGAINQAAGGAARLDKAATQVAGGATSVAAGARQAATGAAAVRDGAHRLAGGAGQLVSGAGRLATGADQLTTAVRRAGTAGQRLENGAQSLAGGAADLADGLNDGRNQVPTYTDAERAHLRDVAATPIEATETAVGGLTAGPIVVLVLWLGALVTLILTPAARRDPLTWHGPTWRLAVLNARPLLRYAAAQAVVVSAAAEAFLRLAPLRVIALLAVAVLIGVAFILVIQALLIGFRTAGRLAAILVPVLALTTAVISAVPGALTTTASYLPTYGPILAVRALTAHGGAAGTGLMLTVGWLAIGVLGVLCATAHRRTVPVRYGAAPSHA